jgi:threonine dehydratase
MERGQASRFDEWAPSFVDGAGGKSVLDTMWPLLREYVNDSIVVSLDEAAQAMRLTAERARVIAEGAGACAVAAAISPGLAARGHRRVVAVVSGGNIDLSKFAQLVGAHAS